MLRIHRQNYHTTLGIRDELLWLSHLSNLKILVPTPQKSKQGHWLETIYSDLAGGERNCCVFKWINGRFLDDSIEPKHLFMAGRLAAQLQINSIKNTAKARQRWDSQGLMGNPTNFGRLEQIPGLSPLQKKIIQKARLKIFKILETYERKYPKRFGLIHADLHFGNTMLVQQQMAAIDFDDCGFGFHIYDLVIPFLGCGHRYEKDKKREAQFRKALFEGYRSVKKMDQADELLFDNLCHARKLLMLAWLHSRSDNPRLKKHFKKYLPKTVRYLKRELIRKSFTPIASFKTSLSSVG